MAINTEKLLNRPSELHKRYSGRVAMQKSLQEKMISGGPSNIVLTKKSVKNIGIIKVNVIKIENILKGTLASEKKALDEKKRKDSSQRREKQEEKLETKPNVERGEIKMPKAPRMGILDWIKNFIGNVLLGYFAVRLIDHLPKIIPIVKFLGKAADFIIDIGGKLLNGLATFIDWGYKAYDATRGFIKGLGGENFAQGFDKFVSAIDTTLFLTTFLAGDLLSEYLFGSDGGPSPGTRMGGKPQVTTSGGGTAGKPDIRNPLRQRPTVTTGQGGKPSGPRLPGTGPKVTGSGGGPKIKVPKGIKARGGLLGLVMMIPDLISAGMLVSQGRGKDGLRALLSAVSGVVAGMAAYSATLAGAAALGITGVGLPAAIGLALAGFGASALAGSAAYNLADAGLKKMGLIDNDPKTGKPYTYRSGGITRGGKRQTGARRSIGGTGKGKYKRVLAPRKPSEVEIGEKTDVGQKEKVFDFFGFVKNAVDAINPFNTIKKSGEELGKTNYFGPILAITSKITLGQKPTQKDYENVGLGINMLVAKGIREKQLKGGLVAAFAEGGLVDPDVLSAAETGGDISNWVAKTFQGEIESNAQKTLRLIKENSEKSKTQKEGPDKSDPTLEGPDEPSGGGGLTKGQWGPLLDLIAGKESGGNYEAMYPSTTLPGATKMTIAEVARKASGAVGKYQQLPQYLVGRAKAAGLNPDKDLYSAENQEKIIINVNIKGRGGQKWLENKISDEQFMQGLSQEFASLPNAQGKFYYSGQRSSMTPEKVKAALSKVKKGGYSKEEIAMSAKGMDSKISLGKGYGSEGSKIAGELGRFMKKKGVVPGSIHRHPEHPPWSRSSGHSKNSYHYQGRAIDLGGYTREQGPILAAIAEFNKLKGVKPVELIHGGIDPKGHSDHVHVAYEAGGETLPYEHIARVSEGGRREIIVDNDSAYSSPQTKNMLLAMNQAKGYKGVMQAIQQYAPYDALSQQTLVVPMQGMSEDEGDLETSGGGMMMAFGGGEDPFESLYQGG